ncbi:hypothetical protein ZWY2020_014406 [Hordeum vulgare]|nr:hypothetical protein ZWY2020_014406 [Hordeum vulgare]
MSDAACGSLPQSVLPALWALDQQQCLPPADLNDGVISDLLSTPAYRSIWSPRLSVPCDSNNMHTIAPPRPASLEILFGLGTQLSFDTSSPESRARAALAQANLSGHGLLSEITTSVSDLQIDEQRQFIDKLISSMSPSPLGSSPCNQQRASASLSIKNKILASISSKSKPQSALRPSMVSSRRTQARTCKALRLISSEDQFSDAMLQAYHEFFKEPVTEDFVAGLTALAGLDSPASIQLPDSNLQDILDKVMVRAT